METVGHVERMCWWKEAEDGATRQEVVRRSMDVVREEEDEEKRRSRSSFTHYVHVTQVWTQESRACACAHSLEREDADAVTSSCQLETPSVR